MRHLIALAVIPLLLAGCSQPAEPTPEAPDVPAAPSRAAVEWVDYDPALQGQIDDLQAAADCDGLQDAFDTADANSAATQDRTGHSNALLMTYIDEALQGADCY